MRREREKGRGQEGEGKDWGDWERNLPDGYESLGTIWNPEVAPRSTVVMDKSSREEKLNVELVSDHFRERIVPSERLSINFRARASKTRIFFRSPDRCAVMRLISYLCVRANRLSSTKARFSSCKLPTFVWFGDP